MTTTMHVLVGNEEGGLIRVTTTNNGATWSKPEVVVPDVEAVAFATGSDGSVYAGTRGAGLLVSRDSAKSWGQLPVPPQLERIRSLSFDNGKLLVGTEPAGVYEYDTSSGFTRQLGDIWGASSSAEWFYPVKSEAVHIRGISRDPHKKERIYAAVQVGGVGISPDNGGSWYDKRNLDLDVHVVIPHPAKPGVVYAGSGGGGLYQSEDFGENWRCVSESCGTFVLDLAMDPTDPERLYLGTGRGEVPSWANPGGARGELFRSDDGGASWQKLSRGLPNQMESRITALAINRADPSHVFFGAGLPSRANRPMRASDAGVYHSANRGELWRQIVPFANGEPPAIWCVPA